MTYKWESPYQWFVDKANEHACDSDWLHTELIILAGKLDNDTLQSLYKQEMDDDGYFEEAASRSSSSATVAEPISTD